MARSPVLVIGVPRSGTSWVTSEIVKRGFWVGPYGKGSDNPRGFFENEAVKREVIKPVLKDKGGLTDLPDKPLANKRVDRIESILERQGWSGEPWVFKDGKMLFCWPDFVRVFPDAQWVKVRRPDADILESFTRTRFMRRIPQKDHRAVLEAYKARLMEAPGMEIWPFQEENWISRLPSA